MRARYQVVGTRASTGRRASVQLGGGRIAAPRGLDANRRVLGDAHPGVAITLNNLATILMRRGRLRDAEPLYREALALNERRVHFHEAVGARLVPRRLLALGPTHPNVAWVAANLARAFAETGRFAEAEALYLRARTLYTAQLPSGHAALRELHGRMASLYRAWKKEQLAAEYAALAAAPRRSDR